MESFILVVTWYPRVKCSMSTGVQEHSSIHSSKSIEFCAADGMALVQNIRGLSWFSHWDLHKIHNAYFPPTLTSPIQNLLPDHMFHVAKLLALQPGLTIDPFLSPGPTQSQLPFMSPGLKWHWEVWNVLSPEPTSKRGSGGNQCQTLYFILCNGGCKMQQFILYFEQDLSAFP